MLGSPFSFACSLQVCVFAPACGKVLAASTVSPVLLILPHARFELRWQRTLAGIFSFCARDTEDLGQECMAGA